MPPTWEAQDAGLSHDQAGLVSVRKGGGAFDFSITLSPQLQLDKTSLVIGKVLEGADFLKEIEGLPVVLYPGQDANPEPDATRSKACFYGGTDSFCSQLKPLKKVTVVKSVLL